MNSSRARKAREIAYLVMIARMAWAAGKRQEYIRALVKLVSLSERRKVYMKYGRRVWVYEHVKLPYVRWEARKIASGEANDLLELVQRHERRTR